MPQEKYPSSCPWDLGPKQKLAHLEEWILIKGHESVRFSKDKEDGNWFNLIFNDEVHERILAYQARLTYQKLLDKDYKLKKR